MANLAALTFSQTRASSDDVQNSTDPKSSLVFDHIYGLVVTDWQLHHGYIANYHTGGGGSTKRSEASRALT